MVVGACEAPVLTPPEAEQHVRYSVHFIILMIGNQTIVVLALRPIIST